MEKEVNIINKMVEDNIKLIYKPTAAYYFSNKSVQKKYEFDELLSIATIGLHKAATKFDKSKGYEFSTYATTLIRYALLQFVRNDKWYFRRNVQKGVETFEIINRVSTSDLVSYPGSKDITLEDSLEDKEDNYKEIEDKHTVNYLLSTCTEREKAILEGYFFDKKSQYVLSKEFKTSQPFISLVIRRNLKRFKELLEVEKC